MIILAITLSACVPQESPPSPGQNNPSEEQPGNADANTSQLSGNESGGRRASILIRAGELTLSYTDGKATLSGTLQRSTPCVDWKITPLIMESFPEKVVFDVEDASTAEMCVQVLGEPQGVSSTVEVSENAHFTVRFKGEEVFEGTLS